MTNERFQVVIAGAGVAGLEAAFALHDLAADSVELALIAPTDEFRYRPSAVGEPFDASRAQHYSVPDLADQAGATFIEAAVSSVDVAARSVQTAGGERIPFDFLLICTGASLEDRYRHATFVDDAQIDQVLHGLVQDIEEGYVKRLAVVVPGPMPWPLPGYELALMSARRAWEMQTPTAVTIFTPEPSPLAAFGADASQAVSRLLSEREIDVITRAYCDVPDAKTVIVHPGHQRRAFDRIIALPALRGPGLEGLPSDGGGFIPVDEYCAVVGVDGVWAAGDGTDYPIKQGGIAAQMADAAASSIAARVGACPTQRPFDPVLEGLMYTGEAPRYLRGHPGDLEGESFLTDVLRGARIPKIAARYLGPQLAGIDNG